MDAGRVEELAVEKITNYIDESAPMRYSCLCFLLRNFFTPFSARRASRNAATIRPMQDAGAAAGVVVHAAKTLASGRLTR